ncbi:hypothetical protein C2845_PM16G06550 [Panicum miliaceum]|uniref:alpha-amylase n=1 Tax=Panicum miliaceum TaxID=4540 RepID=A0A3L6PW84_PANMI|nr:hypothetical protein C2845_PM16G06550 [Panicum miliaceum]
MAVQAQHLLSHAFLPHHDVLGHPFRALEGAAVCGAGGVFLDELGIAGCAPAAGTGDAVFGGAARSELTCNGGGEYDDGLLPRKRARVAAGLVECGGQQGSLVLPLAAPPPQGQPFAGDARTRAVGCGAASTSGRAAASGVLSQLYHQGVEIDALVRLEVSDDKFEEEAARNGGIIKNGREILFQAFNWESNKQSWWSKLEDKVTDLAESGFTSAWLPPPTQSLSREGYLPQSLYCLDSCYGSLSELKSLLHKMHEHNLRAMADVVINHRIGTTQGSNGMYNRYDGIPISWDEHAVTSCSGGKGNKSTGDNFDGVPNIDHTQTFVRKDIIEWLIWLRRSVGFQDFRFDFAKGYAAKFVKEYIEESKPLFAVGEYWDSCEYSPPDYRLNYNQDNHRQRIINWIDSTGGLCAAFDFTTKGILQEAVKGELWRLRDPEGKPPGVMGWWPSRSVTFIENHDTGSTQGYAYILTHPGIPAVFYDHFYDQGSSLHDEIAKLMQIRKCQDIHSRSSVKILEAKSDLYSAIIDEKLCMKIGDGSWCPSEPEWRLAASGDRYAVWHK